MPSLSQAKNLGVVGSIFVLLTAVPGVGGLLGIRPRQMALRACVIFDTRFGNTEKITRALESGIKDAGVETQCLSSKDVDIGSLKEFDLICVGAPTEAFSAYKPTREFLRRLKGTDLTGKYGLAFDTKLGSSLSGSAAKLIERELKDLGVRMVAPRESAIVSTSRDRSGITGAVLKAGEERRFQEIGGRIGAAVMASAKLATP